jgi:hypothetical protein
MVSKSKKNKTVRVSKSKIFLSLYIISIMAVVGLFALQSGDISSSLNSANPNMIANKNNGLVTSNIIKENTAQKELDKTKSSGTANEVMPIDPVYSYDVVNKSANPKLKFGEKTTLTLKIKNTGNATWLSKGKEVIFLGTSRPADRGTVFYNGSGKGWYKENRIQIDSSNIKPGKIATFTFEITAPEKSGIYREFFTPLIEGLKWLDDKDVYWDIEVRDPNKPDEELKTTINGGPIKYINIKLSEQVLYAYDNGLAKYSFQTSTGMDGMNTPEGDFQIYNKFPVQYSAPYELYMDNWMAFTPSGSHGIHSLPYWLLKAGGRLYEGEGHLGTKVSHGCVRVSLENSKLLYDWAEVGTPVHIEN